MNFLKYILMFAFCGFCCTTFATEIEPLANKFEAQILKTATNTNDVSKRAQILFEALKDERAGVSLIFNAANMAVQISDKNKAKELFLLSIKKMPNFYLAHRNLAYLYLEESDFKNAQKEFTSALSLSNQDAQKIYSAMSFCHFNLGNFSSALSAIENALIFAPDDVSLIKRKAQCLNELGDISHLEPTLLDLLNKDKNDVNIWRMLVSLQLKKDEKMQALASLEIMKSLKILEAKDAILLGDIYANLNMFEASANAYMSAKIPQEKAYKIARYFALSNHPTEARKIAENLEKKSWQYFEILGILAQASGEKAKTFFEKSHAKNPLNPFVCLRLGNIALAENNLESARTFYNAAKSEFRREALVGLANVEIAEGKFDDAKTILENLKSEFQTSDFDDIISRLKNAK